MMVLNVKGQIVEVGPGVAGSEAEAMIIREDGKKVFAYAWYFEGCWDYSVTEKSWYGSFSGDDFNSAQFIEHYEDLDDAKASEYYQVFVALNHVLRLTEGRVFDDEEEE